MKTIVAVFRRFWSVLFLAIVTQLGQAQTVPRIINYQGQLTAPGGMPVADGNYSIGIRLWSDHSDTSAGSLVWSNSYNVTVVRGVFNVMLGDSSYGNIAGVLDGAERYLGILVLNGPTVPPGEFTPRHRLVSTPYSLRAGVAETSKFATNALTAKQLENPVGAPRSSLKYVSVKGRKSLALTKASVWPNVVRGDGANLFSITVTPRSATSVMLVTVFAYVGTDLEAHAHLYKNDQQVPVAGGVCYNKPHSGGGGTPQLIAFEWLDEEQSTVTRTYTVEVGRNDSTSTVVVNGYDSVDPAPILGDITSSLRVMEFE